MELIVRVLLNSLGSNLKHHIASSETKSHYKTLCNRKFLKGKVEEIDWENFNVNTCAVCTTFHFRSLTKNNKTVGVQVGSVVKAPYEIAETGWIRIVADQTHCEPNKSQRGVQGWQYQAVEHSEDAQRGSGAWFEVTREEVEKWQS